MMGRPPPPCPKVGGGSDPPGPPFSTPLTGFKALKSDSDPRGGTESSEMKLIAAIDDSFMLGPVEASCGQLKTVEAS